MKITVLMEDTCGNPACGCEHGLSLYIETAHHRILMDTGASDRTWDNARLLGVDPAQADLVVLSHGHYDHAGGLLTLRRLNRDAMIYMQRTALLDYYHHERYIGIAKEIGRMPHVRLLTGDLRIDGEVSLFTGITGRRFWPRGNLALSVLVDGERQLDSFDHEQCLVIEGERNVLLSGCAHNGILNILDRYRALYGGAPDVVVSGFHMMQRSGYTAEEEQALLQTAKELAESGTVYYTGHCTGQPAIDLMQPVLGERLHQMHCGMEILI